MPQIITKEAVTIDRQGPGWQVLNIVNSASIGEPAMVACHWLLERNIEGPETQHNNRDQLLYVIRGSGKAFVDGQVFNLDHEYVLWLEPGETYQFIAGEHGLEILQGYAPGD